MARLLFLKLNKIVKKTDKYRVKSSRRQEVLNHFTRVLLLFAFIFVNALQAIAGPGKTTYQAKIVKPDGYPLEVSSVNFKFTILDPAGSCILYSETYSSVNMSSTGGLISFALGSGVKTYPVSATTFEQVFSNITPSLSCDVGGPTDYTPAASDIRKIVMQFHDGSGWQTLPAMSINAVPYAMYANEATKLNGLTSSDLVQLSTVPTCAASEALRYTGASFSCVAVGNSVTSGTVVTALGYTPADGVSVTTLTANVSSVSSTVFSVSSTVTSLQNSVAASFAAITSSQWTTSGTNIFYNTGNIGIGTTTPVTKLDVSGGVRIGAESTTCAPALAGTLRYNGSNVEYCNGTSWQAFGVSSSGLTSLNGATSQTQSFATGTGGTAPNFNTSNGVHTLNIPNASTGSVTAGLISNADYTTFSSKITSSAASIAQVLGYVPADNAASGTYAQKANNLSDLTNIATARTNLGLGTFATANTVDLGSASATGTLAIARLPSFSGDATIAAASNTIILSNSGVTAGTYTKVTVDTKGRVTSSSALASSDVTTALGYTPASASASTQWTTSGSAIYYNTGNVGIGTSSPVSILHLRGAPMATANNGLVSIGNGPFDGSSSGFFTGNANGVVHAINTASGFTGEFAHYQNGTSDARFIVKSDGSVVSGRGTVNGSLSSSFGGLNTVNGVHAFAVGHFNQSAGNYTFSSGLFNMASGENSTAMGYAITANSLGMTAVGINNVVPTGTSTNTWQATDPVFVIGNGQGSAPASASTAMTVLKNGNVGIGATTPSAKLHLAAGTSSNAPLKFTSGTLLTSPQSGTMEYDGTNFYVTDSTNTRRAIAANTNPGTYDNVSNINSSGNITLTPTGSVVVSSTTASTNSSTGALVVKGGMGVAGDLNVAGTISGSAVIKATGYRANQGAPDAADSSTVGYAFGQDGDTGLFSPGSGSANGVLAFYSNNSEKMRLTSGGALGIGTVAPSGKLSIGGGESADESRLTFQASDNSNRFIVETDLDASTGNDLLGFRSTTVDNILVLKGNGNVGIGTSTPSYPLDVKNQIRVGAQGGSDVSILNGGSGYGANLDLYNVSGTLTTKISANNNSYFNFGSVGIGTTGPVATLDIKGTRQNSITTSNAIFKFGGDDVFLYGGAHNGIGGPNYPIMLQAMRDSDSVTFPLVLNPSGGNVGIGTLTPGYALSVYRGTAGVTTNNESGSAGSVAQNRYAGLTAGSVAQVYGTGLNISNGNGGYEIYDYTAGVSRMFISTAGNVGIGTTSPSFKLDINDGNARISSSNATYTALMIANTVSGNSVTYYDAINGDFVGGDYGYVGQHNSGFMEYNIGSASPMPYHVFSGGNVGIGTTGPTQKLDVVGTIRSGNNTAVQGSILLMDAYTNGSLTNLGTEYSSGGPMLGYGVTPSTSSAAAFLSATPISLARSAMNMSDSIRFYTGAAQTVATGSSVSLSEVMRITNSGNVGIGSSTPTAKFEVSRNFNGESNTTAAFIGGYDAGYTNTGAYFVQKDNTGLGSANTFLFNVVKNNTSQFAVNGAGSVGIGTTSPIATLHVSGTGFVKDGGNSLIELLSRSDSAFNVTNNSTTKRGFSLHHENSSALIAQWYHCPSGVCTQKLSFDYAGNMVIAGTLTQSSDIRLKKDIVPLQSSLDKILSLNGVSYYWKDKEVPGKQIGLIAQEVEKVFPEIIRKDEKGFLSVGYQNLVAPLIESVKELYRRLVGIEQQQIEQQRQIASVVESKADKSEVEKLKAENAALKAYICSKDPKALICQ